LGATGVRKLGVTEEVKPGDAFHLGSCTKAMTAVLVAMLVEEGKLRWEMTLSEAFPELRESMHASFCNVTVDHLLAHRGGLPNQSWPRDKTLDDMRVLPGTLNEQRAQYVAMMLEQEPERPPGTEFIYSNASYVILGVLIERATKTPWEQFIRERIFVPLHMTTAGFGPMGVPGGVEQPWQHKVVGGKLEPVPPEPPNDNPPIFAPSGGIHCSIQNWAAFISALLTDRCDGGLLAPDTRARLLTPQFGGAYAGGWNLQDANSDDPALLHSGSNTMNYCLAVVLPKRQLAVLIATNRGDEEDQILHAFGQLANTLTAKYLPQ